jgi:transposase
MLSVSQEVIVMLLKQYSIKILEQRFKSETDVNVRERIQMMLHLREGYAQREVSSMLHISVGIVPYWKARFEKEGFEGLNDKEGRGRKAILDEEQMSMLGSAIDAGLLKNDNYRRGYKTTDVKEFIDSFFEIPYTARHCRRLLKNMTCSLQVPRPRNKRRNQKDVDAFKEEFKKKEKVWVLTSLP